MQLISPSQSFAIVMLLSGFLPPCAFSQETKPQTANQATGNNGEPHVPVFKAPQGWRKVDAVPVALARFEIGPENGRAIVTVIGLPGEGGGLVANVNRWRSQLNLEPLNDDDARKSARAAQIDRIEGKAVDIQGSSIDGKPAQRILAVMVKHGESTWFFRLSGPADLVAQERSNFTRFLESIQFRTQHVRLPSPVRIDSSVSGHIHPAICVTKKGTLVAVYCKSEYQPYLITRSTDGGKSWSKPALFPHTTKTQVYPGSLLTLADGRLVHAWNVWFSLGEKAKSRYVAYSISSDDGVTWSEPKELAKSKDLKVESVIRHPIVELEPTAWLLPLMDRTVLYNPETGAETPFGDGRNHGLVPIVRTAKGTLISGKGLRSPDSSKTWQDIKPFPDISSQGWRHQLIALKNGWLLASQIVGPGFGGERINFIVSRDDGQSWDLEHPVEFYNPGRAIGGRACPRTVEIDDQTLGTIFYDIDAKHLGGSGVFFRTMPTTRLYKP
jgi:hypothetical protein